MGQRLVLLCTCKGEQSLFWFTLKSILTSLRGDAFGFSAFINGHFLGSGQGTPTVDSSNVTFTFPPNFTIDGTNVLTIITDSMGKELYDRSQTFRSDMDF